MGIMDYLPQFGQNTTQDVSGMPQDDTMMQLELKRKLALADALRQQEAPQGQMVSGRFVAPSWTQHLANAYGKYQAGQQEQGAMKQYGEYQKSKQKRLADALEGLNAETAPKAITEQSAYQIQVPNGQAPQTENLGGMQPIQNGMKTIDVPMTNTTGYQPRTAAERDAAMYKFAVATQNPELMSKVAFDRIAKQDQQEALKAQHEYEFLVHKRDRGEKLTDTENANLFALDKMAKEQGFTAGQNALNRGVTIRGQNMTNANQPLVAILDANGQSTYVPRNQAVGKTPYNQNQSKPSEFESKAQLYSNSMKQASQTLNDLESKKGTKILPSYGEVAVDESSGLGRVALANMRNEDRKSYVQAQKQWIDSINRVRSGANLPEIEYNRAVSTFFPELNDSPERIQQKNLARQQEEASMQAAAGRAAQPNQSQSAPKIDGVYNPKTGKIE